MTKNIINDGYTRRARIAPEERLHSGLEFSFRPMIPEEVEVLDEALNRKGAREGVLLIAQAVAKHLVEWSEIDEHDVSVPIKPDTVRRLPYPLLTRAHKIIAGIMAGDPIEDASQEEADEYLMSLQEGGQAVNEGDRKN